MKSFGNLKDRMRSKGFWVSLIMALIGVFSPEVQGLLVEYPAESAGTVGGIAAIANLINKK